MGNCRDCVHWDRSNDRSSKRPTADHHVCLLITNAHDHSGAPDDHIAFTESFYDPYVGGELVTRGDFGCNQFKLRE